MIAVTTVYWFIVALSKQAVATDSDGIAGHLHCKHLLLLDVVVNSATVYINDFSGTRDPDHLYILFTALTPNLLSKDKRRLYFNHVLLTLIVGCRNWSDSGNAPAPAITSAMMPLLVE
jgi:hypothetical protein